jgi:cobalamin biosynthesis Mg chelatase CobN
MKMWRFAVVVVLILHLGTTVASAQGECVAPPGTAAIDQYCETVPSSKGDRGPSAPEQQRPEQRLPSAEEQTLKQLEQAGSDGRALAEVVRAERRASRQRAARSSSGGRDSASVNERRPATATEPAAPTQNPVAAVTSAAADGPTVSPWLIWIALVVALLFVVRFWVRFRARPPEPVD